MNLKESGLSRVFSHMSEHDTGTISAFRKCYSLKENRQRNKSLLAHLLHFGYDVTAVHGVYIEDYGTDQAEEVAEETFFVVDSRNSGELEVDLRALGEFFEQDSIMYIPKGGNESFLWGTNNAEYPGYGKRVAFSHRGLGAQGEFMTKVKGRPFIFESYKREIQRPDGYLGRMATAKIAKEDWRLLEVD